MAPIINSGRDVAAGDAWVGEHSASLSTEVIHVWRADLQQPDSVLKELYAWLTPDEIDRAGRFRFRHLTNHFIVCRGILRTILAQYLGLHPRSLRFIYTQYGKPLLAINSDSSSLHFNLSHAGNLALFAIARERPVGIDIEVLRPDIELERLAKHFFSPQEQKELFALPLEARTEAFFRCWVRNEAYLKGKGEGLSLPLNTFSVPVTNNTTEMLVTTDPPEPSRWSLHDIAVGPGYMAAMATLGRNWQPVYFEWLAGR